MFLLIGFFRWSVWTNQIAAQDISAVRNLTPAPDDEVADAEIAAATGTSDQTVRRDLSSATNVALEPAVLTPIAIGVIAEIVGLNGKRYMPRPASPPSRRRGTRPRPDCRKRRR
jgi:hypothetical protein